MPVDWVLHNYVPRIDDATVFSMVVDKIEDDSTPYRARFICSKPKKTWLSVLGCNNLEAVENLCMYMDEQVKDRKHAKLLAIINDVITKLEHIKYLVNR
jgi:hypothetical protein